MKKLLSIAIACVYGIRGFAANPTYNSFNPSQFTNNGNGVGIGTGATIDSPNITGTLTAGDVNATSLETPSFTATNVTFVGGNITVASPSGGNSKFTVTGATNIDFSGASILNPLTTVSLLGTTFNFSTVKQNERVFMPPNVGVKRIIFVGPNGNDTNSGTSTNSALASASFATHAVGTNWGDLVWVMPGANSNEINGNASSLFTNIQLAAGVSLHFDAGSVYFMSNRVLGTPWSWLRIAGNSWITGSGFNGQWPSSNAALSTFIFKSSKRDQSVVVGLAPSDYTNMVANPPTNSGISHMSFVSDAAIIHLELSAGTSDLVPSGLAVSDCYFQGGSGGFEQEGQTNTIHPVTFTDCAFSAIPTGSAGSAGTKPRRCVELGGVFTNVTSFEVQFYHCTFDDTDSDGVQTCAIRLDSSGSLTNAQGAFIGCTFTNRLANHSTSASADILATSGFAVTNAVAFSSDTVKSDATAFWQTNGGASGAAVMVTNINQPVLILP